MVDYAVIAICAVLGEYLIPESRYHHQQLALIGAVSNRREAGYCINTLYPFWQHEATTNDTGLLLTLGLWGIRTSDYCLTLPHRIGLRVGVDFIDTMDRYTYYLRYSVAIHRAYSLHHQLLSFPRGRTPRVLSTPKRQPIPPLLLGIAAWCYNGKYLTVL